MEEDSNNGLVNNGANLKNFSIDASRRESVCFTENLMICAKDIVNSETKPIGGYCISVEKIGPEDRELLVNVAASMSVEDHFVGGSKLVGTITENFQCLEEKRTEYLRCTDGTHEKCLYIGSEDDAYHIKCEMNCPCGDSSSGNDIPMKNHPLLLSEAGNIVLMRYLALINYHGPLIAESVTIDGKIESCDYRCTSASWQKLDGRKLEIYRIDRRRRDAETVRESKTLLTKQGRILRHEWLDMQYLLRLNPLVDPGSIEKKFSRRPLRETWPDDMELMSKYLDKKNCIGAQETNYFATHPDIKKLIADYAQALLIVKPVDVIGFTIQHFQSFAPNPESLDGNGNSSEM